MRKGGEECLVPENPWVWVDGCAQVIVKASLSRGEGFSLGT